MFLVVTKLKIITSMIYCCTIAINFDIYIADAMPRVTARGFYSRSYRGDRRNVLFRVSKFYLILQYLLTGHHISFLFKFDMTHMKCRRYLFCAELTTKVQNHEFLQLITAQYLVCLTVFVLSAKAS